MIANSKIKQCTFSVRRLEGSDLLIAEGRDLAAVEAEQQRARLVFELANMGVWTWNLGSDTVSNQSDHPADRAFLLAEADAAVASRSGLRVEVRASSRAPAK